jgi:broad specificity polyphosphatase/5'/3'-nucleotidase SurE
MAKPSLRYIKDEFVISGPNSSPSASRPAVGSGTGAAALADATSGLDLTEDFALGAQQHDAPYPSQAIIDKALELNRTLDTSVTYPWAQSAEVRRDGAG